MVLPDGTPHFISVPISTSSDIPGFKDPQQTNNTRKNKCTKKPNKMQAKKVNEHLTYLHRKTKCTILSLSEKKLVTQMIQSRMRNDS
jgi:hypothetical protein